MQKNIIEFGLNRVWVVLMISGLIGITNSFSQSKWTENSFKDFRDGSFLDAGSNIYVSAAGRIQMITRWDFNGDGNLDILLCTNQRHTEKENTYIYLNNGNDIDARSRIEIPGGGSSDGLVADFNKDAWNDLAVSNYKDSHVGWINSWVYYGSQKGYSPDRRTLLPAYLATGIVAGDFNGDGWQDLAIACQWQEGTEQEPEGPKRSFIYWNSPDGFKQDNRLPLVFDGGGARGVAAGDLDEDGITDLIAMASGKTYLLYSSHKAFTEKDHWISLPVKGNSAAVGNVNGDEFKDIAICCSGGVMLLYGDKGGYDRQNSEMLAVSTPAEAVFSDIDADGFDDVVVANSATPDAAPWADSYVFYSNGSNCSTREPCKLPTLGAHGISAGDLNGDGLPEIVISNRRVNNQNNLTSYVYWNKNGKFFYGNHTQLPTQGTLANTIADVNNDGLQDVIFFNDLGWFQDGPAVSYVYWGDGTRNYSKQRRLSFNTQPIFGQGHADLDDDGQVDLILARSRFSIGVGHVQSGLIVHWGNSGRFENPSYLTMKTGYGGVQIADINKDGYLDMMAGGHIVDLDNPEKHGFPIFWGSSTGYNHSNRTVLHVAKDRMRQPLLVDLNKDGWLDIAGQVVDGKIKFWWGGADGINESNITEVDIGRDDHLMYLKAADFNKDGWLDLLLPIRGPADGSEVTSFIFYGSEEGFSNKNSIEIPCYVTFQNTIADFDKDGWLDIFLCSYGGEIRGNRPSLIYWGSVDGLLKRPRTELPSYGSCGSEAGDFDGDGWLDIVIANHRKTGSYNEPLPHTHLCPSMIYWGSPKGLTSENRLEIESRGPQGMNVRDLGNRYDRGLYEDYFSSPYQIPDGEKPVSIAWEAETLHGTAVKFQIRTAGSKDKLDLAKWIGPKGSNSWYVENSSKIHNIDGNWIQYRARLITPNGGPTPYLTSVTIQFK